MANNTSFTGFEPEVQDITRQREMAKLLMQQGLQNNLQGQMVSGRYVGASPWQGVANIYSAYKGRQLANEADRKQAELAEKLRTLQSTEAQDILSALKGTPSVTKQEFTTEANLPQGQTLVTDEGDRTVLPVTTPAVAGSRQNALAKALAGRSGFSQTMAAKLMEQEFKEPKWEKVERLNARGDTVSGMVDVNSPQPEMTFREIGVSKPSISAADAARLTYEGIPFSGGGVPSGAPSAPTYQTTGQGSPVLNRPQNVTQNAPQASALVSGNVGEFVYNPNLSPKQNRELQGKSAADTMTKVKNAKDALPVIKEAVDILSTDAPSSGRGENIITGAREFFGGGGKASTADSRLVVLGEKLTAQVPRFEGPQSDKDTASYRAAAGDIGNPNKPISSRLAALDTVITLNKKYYPSEEWDKIDLGGAVKVKNPLGGTRGFGAKTLAPDQFMETLSPKDKEAFQWLRKNPNHPKADAIKNSLGID